MDPRVGRRLGDYRIEAELGRGGMATVYRATHLPSGRAVALKTVDTPNERVFRSLRREVRALARVRHPGIVQVLGEGVHEGVPFYAMELVAGRALSLLLASAEAGSARAGSAWWTHTLASLEDHAQPPPLPLGKLPLARALTLARALCEPLAHLHGEALVHRDLKPDNVLVREDGTPVLVDFGLASLAPRETSREILDVRGELAGTAAYMAPELIRGEPVDARADLYALGCMLYEMTTGVRPFAAFTVAAVLRGHLEVVPPVPSSLVPELPTELDALVMRLLAKQAAERPGHAGDVARSLERLGAERPAVVIPARDYLYRPRMAGRDAALAPLVEALRATRRRRGGVWIVAGESGIGKTRLVNELASRAAAQGVAVLETDHRNTLRTLLGALVDRCRARGAVETAQVFGARAAVLTALEPDIATLPGLGSSERPPPLEGDAGRLRLVRALADTVAAAADRGLLWVVDDVQWADSLTLAVLAYLAREPREVPLLVVATRRSDETSEAIETLGREARAITLTRLPAEGVAAIARDMLANEPPAELVEHLVRHSEGNPFFVAEYLRAALETSRLRRDPDGRWRLAEGSAPIAGQPLPDTLRELILRRLATLSPPARALVSLAAIGADAVGARGLAQLAQLDEEGAFSTLDELMRREIAHETGEGRLRFAHDKLREVAYAALDADERRAGHAKIAAVLGADSELAARHWVEAGALARAVEAADLAAGRALSRWSYSAAAAQLEIALAHAAPTDARRAGWEAALAEAKLGLGALSEGQGHLLRALALRDRPVAPDLPRLATGIAEQALAQLDHRLRGASAPTDADEARALARVYQRLVESYWFDNDLARMLDAALRALNLAERAGDSPELVRAYATMALAAGGLPAHRLAERYATLAERAAARVGDPVSEAYTLFLTSVYRVGTGQLDRVDQDLARAATISERIGDPRFLGESYTVLGMSALYRGDHGRAAETFTHVATLGRRHDNAQHRLWAALGDAEARRRRGEPELEASALERARRELASPSAQRLEHLRYEGLLADAACDREDVDAALFHARRARAHAAALPAPTAHYLLEGYAGAARGLLFARARGAASTRETAAALASLEAYAFFFRIGAPRALRHRADLAWLAGRKRLARRLWAAAAARAASLGMVFEREQARVAEAHAARFLDRPR